MTDLTRDAFLGGRLWLWQPRRGYRAGVDPVLLAAAIPAKAGQTVLDLGCGVGAAGLCLATRVPGLQITGVEVQADYADLARRNASESGLPLSVHTADLRDLPHDLRQQQFTHVLMNPPYFERAHSVPADDAGRELAFGGNSSLAIWLDIGIRRLAPKGQLTLIQRVSRLPDVLGAIGNRLGSLVMCPIIPRGGKPPELFLLRGILAGRAAFRITGGLTMHNGTSHESDSDTYTPAVSDVLRNAGKLDIWD